MTWAEDAKKKLFSYKVKSEYSESRRSFLKGLMIVGTVATIPKSIKNLIADDSIGIIASEDIPAYSMVGIYKNTCYLLTTKNTGQLGAIKIGIAEHTIKRGEHGKIFFGSGECKVRVKT